jgi:hypothetical protein
MEITSAEWISPLEDVLSIKAVIDGQEMIIPDDMGNRHRQEIADWEAIGNVIAPYVAPAPSKDYVIGKSTPWRRMTDQEAATTKAAMATQSVKDQMIYDAAAYLDTSDPLFATMHGMLVSLFGDARADALLAPETP